MTDAMRLTLARLPYEEKLRRVAELIALSRRFQATPPLPAPPRSSSLNLEP